MAPVPALEFELEYFDHADAFPLDSPSKVFNHRLSSASVRGAARSRNAAAADLVYADAPEIISTI